MLYAAKIINIAVIARATTNLGRKCPGSGMSPESEEIAGCG